MLISKPVFLKVVGVTPQQLAELHTLAENPQYYLPYNIEDDINDRVYTLEDGVPCVEVMTSRFEKSDGYYVVEVRVLTAVHTKKYKRIGEPKDAKVHACEKGYWIIASSNAMDAVMKILGLSPVKETIISNTW